MAGTPLTMAIDAYSPTVPMVAAADNEVNVTLSLYTRALNDVVVTVFAVTTMCFF